MKRALWLFLAPLFLAAAAFAKEKDTAQAEAKLRSETARAVAEYASWCVSRGAKTEGASSLAEASSLDAGAPGIAATRAGLEALSGDAEAAADAVLKQRRLAGPKIASAYDRLAAVEHEVKDAGRFEDYLFRALAWDASASRMTRIRRSVDDAIGGNRLDEGGRLLVRLQRADPEGVAAGRYEKTEIDLATKDALLLGSESHSLVGYVALPRGWTKGRSYPVLVDVDGAGSNFLGSCRSFANLRASRPVIVVAPVTLSNTNELKPETYACYPNALLEEWSGRRLQFDGPGVDALLAVVTKRFGGEERVFLTGFSGGGQYVYFKLLQDPEHVRGAAPACGNFAGAGVEGAKAPGPGGGPPVHLFTGEKDPHRDDVFGTKPGIEGQTDRAAEHLARLGYTRVERTQVKGAGHDAFPGLVWKFVDQVMGSK